MSISRRDVLKAGAAAGALLVARPLGALADLLGPAPHATSRASRLFPGLSVAHADLHNHTILSDGSGDPEAAFASMRGAGLDVAALTDHTTTGMDLPGMSSCSECSSLFGITEEKWARAGLIADEANSEGSFVGIRGFEWSSPTLGHVNVWFSETWVDPLHTAGASTGEGLGQFLHVESGGALPQQLTQPLDSIIRVSPTSGSTMQPFYEWLKREPSTPVLAGGGDGIAGFNHPGRETGRFGYFAFEPALAPRVVSCEVFNRREDYVFEATNHGVQSPINECLNAGWKVGLLGVTDEHGTDWGYPDGKGRTGLYVSELSRDGVKEAMLARRFFATRLKGLRIDASAAGRQMGQSVPHASGPLQFQIDIDRGSAWWGRELMVQVLQSGTTMPTVVDNVAITVPEPTQPVVTFSSQVDVADGNWVVLRISDPDPASGAIENEYPELDPRARGEWTTFGPAVAYCSPFFLEPPAGRTG